MPRMGMEKGMSHDAIRWICIIGFPLILVILLWIACQFEEFKEIDERDDDDTPYCNCNDQPMIDELDEGYCFCCGKPLL